MGARLQRDAAERCSARDWLGPTEFYGAAPGAPSAQIGSDFNDWHPSARRWRPDAKRHLQWMLCQGQHINTASWGTGRLDPTAMGFGRSERGAPVSLVAVRQNGRHL